MNYTYSFIIPHHNSPELLNRCLDSIPQREDIQIIVVDDNSDINKKPQITRKDVEIVYIDAFHTKGAGHARNEGLLKSKGKWLLFADCDDFYNLGFMDSLDKYKDSDIDMLFFSCNSCNSDTLAVDHDRSIFLHKTLSRAKDGDRIAKEKMMYGFRSPWFKMVNHKFVLDNNILFEEVKRGNDVMFSFATCFNCRKFEIILDKLYCVTYREGSITFSKKIIDDYYVSISGLIKRNSFYDEIGVLHLKKSIISFIIHGKDNPVASNLGFYNFLNHLKFVGKSLLVLIANPYRLYKEKNKYIDVIINKKRIV